LKADRDVGMTAHRLNNAVHKMRWGLQAVGFRNALEGSLRLLKLKVRRPIQGEITLRSGPRLQFAYPTQLPRTLVMFGDFIDPEYAFLREIVRPDWIIADVGAAIGQFSIFAAKLPCAVVHAYEPSSINVATLRANIKQNDVCKRVEVHQIALSNESGSAIFATAGQAWMSSLSSQAQNGERVSVRRLSDELERVGASHLSVLKINVSGHEPEVLAGAVEVLAAGRVDVLILLLGLTSLVWYERIHRLGYRFFYYHPLCKTLYEVATFDEASVLSNIPWPARHIIAIRSDAIKAGILSSLRMERGHSL
jgi:methyltransferase, FkbM family